MKRRKLTLIAVLCALALLCGLPLTSAGLPGASAQARWVVKLGTGARAGSPLAQAMAATADAIDREHASRLWVKRFPDGALARTAPGLTRVASGEVHGYAASFEELSQAVPDLAVLGAPFLFDHVSDAQKALRGRLSAVIRDTLAANGMHLVSVGACDTRELLGARSALETPRAASGLRIVGGATPARAAFAAALSMTPIPGDRAQGGGNPDVYDGTLTELIASGAAARSRHLMLTQHAVECGAVVLSQRWLDGLPEQMRKTVVRMPKDIGADASAAVAAMRPKLIEHARALGLQVHELRASDRRAFASTTRDAYDTLLKGASESAAKILFAARKP